MTAVTSVSYELKQRPRVAVLSAAAGVLLFAGAAVQAAGPQAKVQELTVQLLVTNKRGSLEIIGALVNGLGLLALGAVLAFLFKAVKARRPESAQALWIVAIVGAVLAAIGGIAYGVVITDKAHQFATHGAQTYPQANHLMSASALAVFQIMDYAGELLLAVAFVLVSMQAMRVGLLTRFMGYLGIIGGVLTLFVITPVPVVQFYWLAALAYLLSGRWPNGLPPAWRTGKAERWPSAAEAREQQARARAQRGKAGGRAPALTRDAVPASAAAGDGASAEMDRPTQTRSSTSRSGARRKRKRRR